MIRAADAAGKETKKQVRDRLRKVGEKVKQEWGSEIGVHDQGSAAGLGISVRRAGMVSVEQRRRKTTGKRGDWGAHQMRHGLEVLQQNESGLNEEMERALDDVADIFER